MNNQQNPVLLGFHKRHRRYIAVCAVLAVLAAGLVCFGMVFGQTFYSPQTIFRVLSGESVKGATFTIKTLRLPRVLMGLLAGLCFGMAGNTFQKLLRNPLASPDIIGVTSGASVAAVFAILVLGWSGALVSVSAVVSGIVVAGAIWFFSQGAGFSNGRLILVGIGMQAFLNAVISWTLLKASEYDVPSAMRWLSGSLNGVKMENVPLLIGVLAIAGGGIMLLNQHLSVMQMGEEYAQTLGAHPSRTRLLLILCALCLTAFATASTGPIASVAFLSGPIADRLTGGGKGNMVSSALVGAVLVLAADLCGQYAFPARYPVGVITGILGAPYLLFLLLCMNKKGGN